MNGTESIMTEDQTLAAQHADSLLESIRARVESGAPFGHVDSMGACHDTDECEDYDEGECEDAGAVDYLANVLDIQYLVNSDAERSYRGARLMLTMGGPTVYVDTFSSELLVMWGGTERRALPPTFVDALDEALGEMWEMC